MNPHPKPACPRGPDHGFTERLILWLWLISLPQTSCPADPPATSKYELAYATYLGGTGDEMIRSLALGSKGEMHLAVGGSP